MSTVPVTEDSVVVRVAQRVTFDLLTEPLAVYPDRPRITLGGVFELGDQQAEAIGRHLLAAMTFIRGLPGMAGQRHLKALPPTS